MIADGSRLWPRIPILIVRRNMGSALVVAPLSPCSKRPPVPKAFSVGKPRSYPVIRTARKELGLSTEETTMIGDTMETDILGGVANWDIALCSFCPEPLGAATWSIMPIVRISSSIQSPD